MNIEVDMGGGRNGNMIDLLSGYTTEEIDVIIEKAEQEIEHNFGGC